MHFIGGNAGLLQSGRACRMAAPRQLLREFGGFINQAVARIEAGHFRRPAAGCAVIFAG